MIKLLKWLDSHLLFAFSAFLIAFIPLMPKLPLLDALPGYIVRVRIEDFIVSFAILLWLFYLIRGKTKLSDYPLFKPILIYLTFGFLTMITAVFVIQTVPLQTLHIGKMVLHYLRRIEYFSLFFILFSSIRNLKQVKILIGILLATVVCVAVYGFGQKYLYWPAFSTMNREFSKGWVLYLTEHARVLSTFGGHYDLAAFIMMVLILLWSLFFAVKRWYLRAGVFVIIGAAFWTLILTASRISFLAYLGGLTFMFFIWAYRKGIAWSVARWIGVITLSIVLMLSFGDLSERFTKLLKLDERLGNIKSLFMSPLAQRPTQNALFLENNSDIISQITSKSDMPPSLRRPSDVYEDVPLLIPTATDSSVLTPTNRTYSNTAFRYDLSTAIRLDALWPMAIAGFKRDPLLGSGYATLNKQNVTDFTDAESTDNDYLRTLGETGILGFVAFYGTVIVAMYLVWRNLKVAQDPIFFSLFAGFIGLSMGLFANAVYIDVFVSSKVAFTFWAISGIILSALMILKKDHKGPVDKPSIPDLSEFFIGTRVRILHFIKGDLFILLVILGLAFFVRLYKITSPIADWHSWRQADTSSVTRSFVRNGINLLYPTYHDLSNVASGKDNPNGYRMVEFPLYNFFSTVTDKIFVGYTIEISGRLTSIFASLLSIIFLFLIARRFLGRRESVLTAIFFAVIPYNIFFSRVILPEPLLASLSVGMIYFFDTFAIHLALFSKGKREKRIILKLILTGILALLFASGAALIKPISLFLYPVVIYVFIRRLKLSFSTLLAIGIALFATLIPLLLWRKWVANFPEGVPAYTWLLNGDGIRFKGAWFYWIFADRIGRLILGYWGVVFVSLGLLFKKPKEGWVFHIWGLGALLYLVVIATGNVRHDYYQIFIVPILCIFAAKGVVFLLDHAGKIFNRVFVYPFVLICFIFMLMFGWYFIKDYYNINHPEIIEAGLAVEKYTPDKALVVAPYNGDTAFLYQTHRWGWPVLTEPIDSLVKKGADYYVSLNYDDVTQQLMREALNKESTKGYKIIQELPNYILIQLVPDKDLPQR
ncbi:hypothetical protein A3D77_02365 [Candidatus Gottesmanbacteria bacterium RIFCSPHIGHO2_02_FULL_39_11]|uniref:O-antigen ligase-related domain-containing protein n=1 Tax=Candidatus Gottesmanbacteria bacterium RIFCSPHIGHO2_02_FULL_39_11 TaxID=1798382 RepID=A0A1F5ZUZ8_9BACT|nr:MAG: hypothetical protein A3D77_02365 [Candidatus Gottesmanbacteria bacterium RIFCSPHIGHO2_02_FULL_39_11]